MQRFLVFCLGLFLSLNAFGQDSLLLSEENLMKKPLYTDMMKAFKEYDKVYRLSLKGSGGFYGKVDMIHPRIDSLINLQYFYVVNEAIEDLPKGLGKLQNLQQLYLSGNKIKTIPDTLYSLKHLKRLDLRGNQLLRIAPEIEKLVELEFLYLNDNPNLDFLPAESIGKLKNLKYLNVKGTKINRNQMETIKKLLPKTQIEY
jgi:Leucine-rich repeat (LRR) protein